MLFEHIMRMETIIEARIKDIEENISANKTPFIRKAAASKAAQNIRELGSDKAGFRLWDSQFINPITQIHTGARYLFEAITTKLDQHRIALSETDIIDIMRNTNNTTDITHLNKDIYYILLNKCTGEALTTQI